VRSNMRWMRPLYPSYRCCSCRSSFPRVWSWGMMVEDLNVLLLVRLYRGTWPGFRSEAMGVEWVKPTACWKMMAVWSSNRSRACRRMGAPAP
jgi:hypothetical protein